MKKAKLTQPQNPNQQKIYWLNQINTSREDGTPVELKPTPEQIAVAIAKCSRSSTPFDQNIDDVSTEKAAEFHEKWVVGYGHSSVAEHAVSSVAFQNIPQPVIKILEDSRLASFTEKSSRYQIFTRDRVAIPETLQNSIFAKEVNELFDELYRLYDECYILLKPIMQKRAPQNISEGAKKAIIKAMICDRTRYLLPAAALGSLGMTTNARVWEHVIIKLLSSADPLAQKIGQELKTVLKGQEYLDKEQALENFPLPTLLKYAEYNPYISETPQKLSNLIQEKIKKIPEKEYQNNLVKIIFDDISAEDKIASNLLAKYGQLDIQKALQIIKKDPDLAKNLIHQALKNRGEHDAPLREFEHANFQHEIIIDYGAWRDIQRHRLCTQSNQPLGTDLGYEIPPEIKEINKYQEFQYILEKAKDLHKKIFAYGLKAEAEYVVPMAFRRRVIISWNLRELFHFIELRSSKKGHPSYRHIAQEVWKTINRTHPFLASYIRVDFDKNENSTLGNKPKGF